MGEEGRPGYASTSTPVTPVLTAPRPPGIPSYSIRQKALAAHGHHHDASRPGKPLFLMIPAGLIALAALGGMLYFAYRAFHEHVISSSTGWSYLVPLGVVYLLAIFLFSYGYELYDMKKSVRLALIIGILGLAVVVVSGALFALLAAGGSAAGGGSKGGSGGRSGGSAKSQAGSGSHVSDRYYGSGPFWYGWWPGRRTARTASDPQGREMVASANLTCSGCGRAFPSLAIKDGKCPYCGASV